MKIGVLALQGAFIEHEKILEKIGVETFEIRKKSDLTDAISNNSIDGLIIPGGESTAIGKLLHDLDLFEDIRKVISDGLPTFGTCAGLILLAKKIENDNYLHASIFSRKQITIDGGCSIIANTHIRAVNTLNINKSNIQIIQNQGDYALLGGEGVILSNCEIVSPIGAITQKYNGYYSVVKDGRRCAEVKIVKNSF